ncbi:Arginine utilization regulatory protein RocR [Bacillus sp. THAF10]|uniref:sigma-54 interaction domain-containing protein n=1 Tax=Bacillus sp. THAF10 TaxID=2587848 RepID=UPI0012679C3A|nr:sigma 54-interacting transcriptional regulator [Bacillus sp. THAF10]QFT89258.1 Arginine utilization regulatory protein RocR [Bacillus sp. THAF10]
MIETQNLSKEMLRAILDGIDEAIHAVDKEGKTIYYNKVAASHDGMNQEEVLGKHILSVFPSLTEETSTILKVLKTKNPIYHKNQRFENKKGQLVETVNTTLPIIYDGTMLGAVEIAKNYGQLKTLSNNLLDLQSKVLKSGKKTQASSYTLTYSLRDFLTVEPECMQLLKEVTMFANTSFPILVCGETGTGKEIIAQGIHHASPRRHAPFIAQNCGAIPETLLESILFGTAKGSYTGAADRPGLFEMADGGSLFLDEMNSMPKELQAKLLRVIEDGYVRRVGGTTAVKVDVRIITAMNEMPEKCVAEGKLREDLFFRLNTCPVYIPPLRTRPADIDFLISNRLKKHPKISIIPQVLDMLQSYRWPGNVRELLNTLDYLLLKAEKGQITTKHIPGKFYTDNTDTLQLRTNLALRSVLQETEEGLIKEAIRQANGNIMKAAKLLKIPRQTLQYKLSKMESAK